MSKRGISWGKTAFTVGFAASTAAFVSVGFAAWYVTGEREYPVHDGNVVVEGVLGNTASITFPDEQRNQSVVYGAPEDAVPGEGLLPQYWIYSDGENIENLTLEYDITFENIIAPSRFEISITAEDNSEGEAYVPSFSEDFEYGEASYESAVEAGFIRGVEEAEISFQTDDTGNVVYQEGGIVTLSGLVSASTAHIEISFLWGEKFNGENPYKIFKDYTEESDRLYAAETLSYIEACLKDVTYVISFTRVAVED